MTNENKKDLLLFIVGSIQLIGLCVTGHWVLVIFIVIFSFALSYWIGWWQVNAEKREWLKWARVLMEGRIYHQKTLEKERQRKNDMG